MAIGASWKICYAVAFTTIQEFVKGDNNAMEVCTKQNTAQ